MEIDMKKSVTVLMIFLLISSFGFAQAQKNAVLKESIGKIDKSLLIGIWGVSKNENASFNFTRNYVYYVDSDTKLKYVLKGNVLSYYENNVLSFKAIILKLDKDSLILKDPETDEINRFIKLNQR
jgi:hypothetical protein